MKPSNNNTPVKRYSALLLEIILSLVQLHQVAKFWQILTHTVVTQAAMGGPRRAECFTSEAVFELYHLLVDEDLFGSRRGAIRRGS